MELRENTIKFPDPYIQMKQNEGLEVWKFFLKLHFIGRDIRKNVPKLQVGGTSTAPPTRFMNRVVV